MPNDKLAQEIEQNEIAKKKAAAEEANNEAFREPRPGDVVELNSGSHQMTFGRLETPGDSRMARCYWYDGGGIKNELLDIRTIKIIREGSVYPVPVGTVVKLASGSPKMTIAAIHTPHDWREAELHWHNSSGHAGSVRVDCDALIRTT